MKWPMKLTGGHVYVIMKKITDPVAADMVVDIINRGPVFVKKFLTEVSTAMHMKLELTDYWKCWGSFKEEYIREFTVGGEA